MTTEEIHERLRGRFGEDVGAPSEAKIDCFLTVKGARIVDVCRFLKTDPGLEFDLLEDLTALDWPKRNVIEVVYHLVSLRWRHTLVLKVDLDRDAPALPSVEGVWKTANWFEREAYDLFGVAFSGHPDLRRILLPDDWTGHPLRKDYQEAGGWHGISNQREDPLVELRRLDEVRRAEAAAKAASAAPASSGAPAAPSADALKG
jgi:NADH-quinone oxidoreductase subunit C